jgi:type II secretory pathway predicted ATPase ExeA/cytoskeletal protein CcmA (bactofilin family)
MVEKYISRIGRSMNIIGRVQSQGHVLVDGDVEGSLACDSIEVAAGGRILGEICAEKIECLGGIEGSVKTRKFIMRRTGCHSGTVETTELRVEPGSVIDCVLQSGMYTARDDMENGKKEDGALRGPVFDWGKLAGVFKNNEQQCLMDVPWSERKELLDQILALLEKDKPLIKIIGDVGSGKSTLIAKLEQVLSHRAEVLVLDEPVGSVKDLLSVVARCLGVEVADGDRQKDIVGKIKSIIVSQDGIRRRVVLAVDNAHMMYPATMEGIIRWLTCAYEGGEALLQIILLGTDEIEGKLVHTTREYFEDETNCLLTLEPLSIKDTSEYLRFCLQIAEGEGLFNPADLFPFETLKKVHSRSRGNIREINSLVTRAFLLAAQSGSPVLVTHHIQTR